MEKEPECDLSNRSELNSTMDGIPPTEHPGSARITEFCYIETESEEENLSVIWKVFCIHFALHESPYPIFVPEIHAGAMRIRFRIYDSSGCIRRITR